MVMEYINEKQGKYLRRGNTYNERQQFCDSNGNNTNCGNKGDCLAMGKPTHFVAQCRSQKIICPNKCSSYNRSRAFSNPSFHSGYSGSLSDSHKTRSDCDLCEILAVSL